MSLYPHTEPDGRKVMKYTRFHGLETRLRWFCWRNFYRIHDWTRRMRGLDPVQCHECHDKGCTECCEHDFDASEGGYCMNDCGANGYDRDIDTDMER